VINSLVCGLSTGVGGIGESAAMLYHCFGISLSFNKYLACSDIFTPPGLIRMIKVARIMTAGRPGNKKAFIPQGTNTLSVVPPQLGAFNQNGNQASLTHYSGTAEGICLYPLP